MNSPVASGVTGERLRECLGILGWTHAELARRLSLPRERTVREWVGGVRPIPVRIGEWIEDMVRLMESGPEPP
jgi:hypothetical protein